MLNIVLWEVSEHPRIDVRSDGDILLAAQRGYAGLSLFLSMLSEQSENHIALRSFLCLGRTRLHKYTPFHLGKWEKFKVTEQSWEQTGLPEKGVGYQTQLQTKAFEMIPHFSFRKSVWLICTEQTQFLLSCSHSNNLAFGLGSRRFLGAEDSQQSMGTECQMPFWSWVLFLLELMWLVGCSEDSEMLDFYLFLPWLEDKNIYLLCLMAG